MNESILTIPLELSDPFFFPMSDVMVDQSRFVSDEPIFAYELLYYNKCCPEVLPWMEHESFIRGLLKSWGEKEENLKNLFKSRTKDTLQIMKKAIAQFFMFMYWSNGQPVRLEGWESHIAHLSIKPVNVVERLIFIRMNATQYHSYIQLSQLFEEQHKHYAKYLALNLGRKK